MFKNTSIFIYLFVNKMLMLLLSQYRKIIHLCRSAAPKEKPCYTLPTVKKLLEQKRKRETSSAPPSCASATNNAGAAVPVPIPVSTRFHLLRKKALIFQYEVLFISVQLSNA